MVYRNVCVQKSTTTSDVNPVSGSLGPPSVQFVFFGHTYATSHSAAAATTLCRSRTHNHVHAYTCTHTIYYTLCGTSTKIPLIRMQTYSGAGNVPGFQVDLVTYYFWCTHTSILTYGHTHTHTFTRTRTHTHTRISYSMG